MFACRYQLVAVYLVRWCQPASIKIVWMKSGKISLVNSIQYFKKTVKHCKNEVTLTLNILKMPNAIGNGLDIRKIQAFLYRKCSLAIGVSVDLQGVNMVVDLAEF